MVPNLTHSQSPAISAHKNNSFICPWFCPPQHLELCISCTFQAAAAQPRVVLGRKRSVLHPSAVIKHSL